MNNFGGPETTIQLRPWLAVFWHSCVPGSSGHVLELLLDSASSV